jgi:hypothetical protein
VLFIIQGQILSYIDYLDLWLCDLFYSACSSSLLDWSNFTLYYGQVSKKTRDLKLIFGTMASTREVIFVLKL